MSRKNHLGGAVLRGVFIQVEQRWLWTVRIAFRTERAGLTGADVRSKSRNNLMLLGVWFVRRLAWVAPRNGAMADASRFPQLALPFAIVGAAAGWLSTSFLANPLVHVTRAGKQGLAAFCAMSVAAATGALLTRWCVGKRYAYELAAPDPDALARTDTWPRRVGAVLAAGTVSGAVVATLYEAYGGPTAGAVSGFFCSIAFVPVCTVVVAAARRAQRARLGSLVAGSDRRAVWGILSTALALATLEALLDWPASAGGEVPAPMPALRMVQAAGILTLAILVADVIALRRARRAIAPGLEHQSPTEIDAGADAVSRLDLGLGEDRLARFARSGSAYRGRDRTLAQVLGSPEQATSALRRAIRRGAIGLVVIGAVYGGHAAAHTRLAREIYEEYRCEQGDRAYAAGHRTRCDEGSWSPVQK